MDFWLRPTLREQVTAAARPMRNTPVSAVMRGSRNRGDVPTAPPRLSCIFLSLLDGEVLSTLSAGGAALHAGTLRYGQTSLPRGNGIVQFFVVPSCVTVTLAVAVPSYVTTSRRVDVVATAPSSVITTFIERVTTPAVG